MLLMGCGKSDLSSGAVTDPSLFQVNVVVHRRVCYDGNASSIRAYLKDKAGKKVTNKAIQIRVNGQALRLNGGSTNYYGAFPYYELLSKSAEVVQGGITYAFTMVLTSMRTVAITQAVRAGSNITSELSTFYRIDVVE